MVQQTISGEGPKKTYDNQGNLLHEDASIDYKEDSAADVRNKKATSGEPNWKKLVDAGMSLGEMAKQRKQWAKDHPKAGAAAQADALKPSPSPSPSPSAR